MQENLTKYEIRTNKKKAAIIDAAKALFQKKGFAQTSIKEVAARACVSQVSIYNYFGSKDSLVIECVKAITQETIDKAYKLLDSAMPYPDKLNAALSLCSGEIEESLKEYLSVSLSADDNFQKLLAESVFEVQRELYISYIEAGKREGYIDSGISESFILKYIAAVNTIPLSKEQHQEEIEMLRKMILHGLILK